MKKQLNIIISLCVLILLFIGCSENSNPLEPNEPGGGNTDPDIKNPVYLKLTNIKLSRFPAQKSNGDKWDYHVFPNSPTRRPDIYVELVKSGSTNILYKSDTKEDAILETAYDSYSFNRAGDKDGKSLPISLNVDQTYNIKLFDDDGFSSNDKMTEFSFNGFNLYKNDNAEFAFHTFTSGSYTLKIEGRWVY
jgi:hypothetical protein